MIQIDNQTGPRPFKALGALPFFFKDLSLCACLCVYAYMCVHSCACALVNAHAYATCLQLPRATDALEPEHHGWS